MSKLRLLLSILLCLLLAPTGLAQDDENPTVAILRFGRTPLSELAKKGILDMLQAYQIIDAEERALLNEEQDLSGDRLNVIWGDGGMDLPTANLMVEDALDRGADVLMPLMTPVAQIAVNLTQDLDNPPLVLFSIVSAPYTAGIADSPCIKPDYVAGTQAQIPYDLIVPLLHVQDPDIQIIGTLVNPAEANSVYGLEQIIQHSETLGVSVEVASVASLSDLPVATETLMDKGIDALLLSGASVEIAGASAIMAVAAERGIPVFSPVVGSVNRGVHVGAGFHHFYREGLIVGRILLAHLQETIDIATLAINSTPSLGVALNLDAADAAGITFSEELLAIADYVIEDGLSTQDRKPPSPPEMPLEERRAADLEFLAGLECTEEMIAEQQAALDAASE